MTFKSVMVALSVNVIAFDAEALSLIATALPVDVYEYVTAGVHEEGVRDTGGGCPSAHDLAKIVDTASLYPRTTIPIQWAGNC